MADNSLITKSQLRQTVAEVAEAITNAEDIFVATYGTTTLAELTTAYNAGKHIVVKYAYSSTNEYYPLQSYNGSVFAFTGMFEDNGSYMYVITCDADGWGNSMTGMSTWDDIGSEITTHNTSTSAHSDIRNAINAVAPIVTATSDDGVTYTGTATGITELTAGQLVVFVSSKTSASTAPTLNINSLGAKTIKRRLSGLSSTTTSGLSNNWLYANKPQLLMYDGTYWIVVNQDKPSFSDLYGVQSETWTFTLEDGSTVTKTVVLG